MPHILYYHSLSPTATDFLATTMQSLHSLLTTHALNIRLLPLPENLASILLPPLESGHYPGTLNLLQQLTPRIPLTLLCPHDHPAAKAARKSLPRAHRGISCSGLLSLTYPPPPPNPFILWHETLHLLGAQDHYDPITLQPTCPHKNCLMHYAPVPPTTPNSPPPSICPATLAILRNTCTT